MKKKLKIYSYQGYRRECPPAPNGSRQTSEVVAAYSKAQVKAIAGVPPSEIHETGNNEDIAKALSEPGRIFWQPLLRHDDKLWRDYEKTFESAPTPPQG
jgi:hypothetical protein